MGIAKRYGYCICHNTMSSLNAKGLCPIGAKERHEKSAESKGLTIKKKDDDINRSIENDSRDSSRLLEEKITTTPINKAKAKIKYRSEKNKELVKAELLVFKKIWESRPHYCEVTGKPIHGFDVRCFSHVLTKGAYVRFRLYEKNIVLCLPEKHHEWEFCTRKTLELSWIETLELALKTEYYRKI